MGGRVHEGLVPAAHAPVGPEPARREDGHGGDEDQGGHPVGEGVPAASDPVDDTADLHGLVADHPRLHGEVYQGRQLRPAGGRRARVFEEHAFSHGHRRHFRNLEFRLATNQILIPESTPHS